MRQAFKRQEERCAARTCSLLCLYPFLRVALMHVRTELHYVARNHLEASQYPAWYHPRIKVANSRCACAQGQLDDQHMAELRDARAQLSSTQNHQTRLRAQLYEARQAASAQVSFRCAFTWTVTQKFPADAAHVMGPLDLSASNLGSQPVTLYEHHGQTSTWCIIYMVTPCNFVVTADNMEMYQMAQRVSDVCR